MSESGTIDMAPANVIRPVPREYRIPETKRVAQHLAKELGVTGEELGASIATKSKLEQEHKVVFLPSQIDLRELKHVWEPDANDLQMLKIDFIDWLYPFLPKDIQEKGLRQDVFAPEVVEAVKHMDTAAREKMRERAKGVFLALFGTGQGGVGLHAETDKSVLGTPVGWDFAVGLTRYLGNMDKAGEFDPEGQLPQHKATEAGHMVWAVTKNEEDRQAVQERMKNILSEQKTGFAWDAITRDAWEVFWQTQRGYRTPDTSYKYGNFEMFFLSGYTDEQLKQKAVLLFPGAESVQVLKRTRVLERLAQMSAAYSRQVYKSQILMMKERYGITTQTIHAAPLGSRLSPAEFNRFKTNFKDMVLFAREEGVTLQIETQGLSSSQWEELFADKSYGWGKDAAATFDLIHVREELRKHKAAREAGVPDSPPDVDYWVQKIREGMVTEVHLSSSEAVGDWYRTSSMIKDDHQPIARTQQKDMIDLRRVVQTASARNRTLKDGQMKTLLLHEAVTTDADYKLLLDILESPQLLM